MPRRPLRHQAGRKRGKRRDKPTKTELLGRQTSNNDPTRTRSCGRQLRRGRQRRTVNENDRRIGDEFDADRDTLAFAAGDALEHVAANVAVGTLGEIEGLSRQTVIIIAIIGRRV